MPSWRVRRNTRALYRDECPAPAAEGENINNSSLTAIRSISVQQWSTRGNISCSSWHCTSRRSERLSARAWSFTSWNSHQIEWRTSPDESNSWYILVYNVNEVNCFCLFVFSKVVRRSSVNERSSLYRREHQKEAMVWQERQTDALDDDEDRQTDAELNAALVTSSVQLLKSLECSLSVLIRWKDIHVFI